MNASQTCDLLISQLKYSNLNYTLSESPYSVNLSIKKTFTVTKEGKMNSGSVPNFFDVISLINLNQELLNQRNTVIKHVANLEHEREALVTELSSSLQKAKIDISELSEVKNNLAKVKDTSDNLVLEKQTEISELKSKLDALQSEIRDLSSFDHREQGKLEKKDEDTKFSNKNGEEQKVIKLNKQLSVMKTKFKDEKDALTKEFKAEIKYWRKELGTERSINIKSEKEHILKRNPEPVKNFPHSNKPVDQLPLKSTSSPSYSLTLATSSRDSSYCDNLAMGSVSNNNIEKHEDEIVCTICAEPIINYVPKYFHGWLINPACQDCDDTSEESEPDEEPG